jgi:hypothetical protein
VRLVRDVLPLRTDFAQLDSEAIFLCFDSEEAEKTMATLESRERQIGHYRANRDDEYCSREATAASLGFTVQRGTSVNFAPSVPENER